jgi:hypothetical protein
MAGRRITAGGRNSSYRQDNRTGGGRNAARYAKASAYYNYGSAAQKVQPQRLPDVRRRRSEEELNRARMAARYNREKSRRMNPALVVFMVMIFSRTGLLVIISTLLMGLSWFYPKQTIILYILLPVISFFMP